MLRKGVTTLFRKLADLEDGRLMSKHLSYQGLDFRFFYRTQRGEKVRK